MNQPETAELQERSALVGRMLLRLAEQPDVLDHLRVALDAWDTDRFRQALERAELGPPGESCDPYVAVIIGVIKGTGKFVERCTWLLQPLDVDKGQQLARAVVDGATAEHMLEILKALGLITCQWVWEDSIDFLEARRFVQGMCPPGTF